MFRYILFGLNRDFQWQDKAAKGVGRVTYKHPETLKILVEQITFILVLGPEREFKNEFKKNVRIYI